jgi:hypothetical protein
MEVGNRTWCLRALPERHLLCCLGRRSGLLTPCSVPLVSYQPHTGANLLNNSSVANNAALGLALQQHLDKLDQAERVAFEKAYQNISIEGLFTKVREFDSAHNEKATCRRCTEPVTKFLRATEQFVQGIAIGIQSYPEVSSLVVGAVRVMIDVCGSFGG